MKIYSKVNALKISLIYLVIGLFYIIISDVIVNSIVNPETLTNLHTYKGVTFIVATSVILYLILNTLFQKLDVHFHKSELSAEKLKLSESKFRKLIENAPDGIAVVGIDGKFKYVSPNALKMFGYEIENSNNLDPNLLTHPDDIGNVMTVMQQLIIDPTLILTLQYRFKHSDQRWLWIESTFSNCLSETGIDGIIINFRSIEERKLIEDELVKKQSLYRKLFDLSPSGILLEDLNGTIIDINDTYLKITGYNRNDLIGKNIRKIVPPENLNEIDDHIEAIKSGDTLMYEVATLCKNGLRKAIDLREAMITLPNGELGIIVVVNDISERKEAENALLLSERKYRGFIDGMLETVWLLDFESNIIDVNQSAVRVMGYSYDELISMKISQIDWDMKHQLIEKLVSEMRQDKIQKFETIHTTRDGKKIPVEISSSLIDYDGQERILSIARNISDRKAAEAEINFQAKLLNTIGQAVIANKSDGSIVYWNKAAEEMFGWEKSEIIGKNISEQMLVPGYENNADKILSRVMSGGFWSGDFPVKRKGGIVFPVFVTTSPILNDQNEVIGVISILTDITERVKHEFEIQESRKKLRALSYRVQELREEERTAIARELHDQLGQHLTAIKIDLQTIHSKHKSNEQVSTEINPVINLVEESIVSVRKLSSALRPNILDQLGLLASMEWQLNEHQKGSNTNYSFKKPEKTGKFSSNKTLPIFRVFQELLTNIARHAKATYVNVVVEVNDQDFYLKVEDNGIGLDLNMVKDIRSLGILGMKERLDIIEGSLNFRNVNDSGTIAEVFVPEIFSDEINIMELESDSNVKSL